MLANCQSLFRNEAVKVDFELIVEAETLVYLIKNLPGKLPSDLLLSPFHLNHVFFLHVLVNLIMELDILPVEFNIELVQLVPALVLQFFDNVAVEFTHFSSIISISRTNFHYFQIFRKSFDIAWGPYVGVNSTLFFKTRLLLSSVIRLCGYTLIERHRTFEANVGSVVFVCFGFSDYDLWLDHEWDLLPLGCVASGLADYFNLGHWSFDDAGFLD